MIVTVAQLQCDNCRTFTPVTLEDGHLSKLPEGWRRTSWRDGLLVRPGGITCPPHKRSKHWCSEACKAARQFNTVYDWLGIPNPEKSDVDQSAP